MTVEGRKGRQILFDLLEDEGVDRVFGNPGGTELCMMDELAARPHLPFVLGLQENTVIGMAEGYARATGRPAFVILHSAPGVGGAMSNLINAAAHGTPLVIVAGQPDRHTKVNLVGIVGAATKWQHEVTSLQELGGVIRQAFATSITAPTGPVFVSIPQDILEEVGTPFVPERAAIDFGTHAGGLNSCAQLLATTPADRLAILAAEDVSYSSAVSEVVALAERLDCDVYVPFRTSDVSFPSRHALWRGMVAPSEDGQRAQFEKYEVVLQIGGRYPYSAEPALPSGVQRVILTSNPTQIARSRGARLAMTGDIKASVQRLCDLVEGELTQKRGNRRQALEGVAHEQIKQERQAAAEGQDDDPMRADGALLALLESVPPGAVVVDESMSSTLDLRRLWRTDRDRQFFSCRTAGLGWGMPFSVGLKLANPTQAVLCIVGDGGANFAIQSLYSAAKYNAAIVVAVLNNAQYRILKQYLMAKADHSLRTGNYVGMELDSPQIDFVSLASSYGVSSARVCRAEELSEEATAAFAADRPYLIDIQVQRLA